MIYYTVWKLQEEKIVQGLEESAIRDGQNGDEVDVKVFERLLKGSQPEV